MMNNLLDIKLGCMLLFCLQPPTGCLLVVADKEPGAVLVSGRPVFVVSSLTNGMKLHLHILTTPTVMNWKYVIREYM